MSLPIKILIVEGNPAEAQLARQTIRDNKVPSEVTIVTDGEEAMKYLRKAAPYSNSEIPDLILLALNLPKKSGKEVLAEIKSDDKMRRIPVVVLALSGVEQDVLDCYNLHANAYITKPVDYDEFVNMIDSLLHFWSVLHLPALAAT